MINSLIAKIEIDNNLKKYLAAAVYEPWFDLPVTEYIENDDLRKEMDNLIDWLF